METDGYPWCEACGYGALFVQKGKFGLFLACDNCKNTEQLFAQMNDYYNWFCDQNEKYHDPLLYGDPNLDELSQLETLWHKRRTTHSNRKSVCGELTRPTSQEHLVEVGIAA